MERKSEVPMHLTKSPGATWYGCSQPEASWRKNALQTPPPVLHPISPTNTSTGGTGRTVLQHQLSVGDIIRVMKQHNYNSHQATQEYIQRKTLCVCVCVFVCACPVWDFFL